MSRAEIQKLGSQAMAVIFGGESTSSLSAMRCKIFTKKVATAKSFVTPERLPPTESVTKVHRLRVVYGQNKDEKK